MSSPLLRKKPENEWKLVTNTTYQEVMKTLMSLVTASLVLPLFLIRNFLGVPEGQLITGLQPSVYWAWGFLVVSLLCGMIFYWASAKFVKVVSGGPEKRSEYFFEHLRDFFASAAVLSFLAGLFAMGWFFLHFHKG